MDGENKAFHVKKKKKNKLKQHLSTNRTLQKLMEGQLQPKEINHHCENSEDK